MRWCPHKYQERAVRHLLGHERAALWLDMGLGKTVATLTAVRDLLDSVSVCRVLIVAPLRVMLTTWPAEIAKWDHTRHLTYTLVRGSAVRRRQLAARPTDVTLVNYENLVDLVAAFGESWPWDMVVFDESSKMKSSTAKRWRAMRKVMKSVSRVVLLTGTPAPNGLTDLWAQLYLLDFGYRLGSTKTAFLQRWFTTDYWGHTWTPQPWAAEQIHAAVADVCLSMQARDYLELPPLLVNPITVPLPADALDQYAELEKEMLLELGDQAVTAANAAVLTGKLMQLANGAVYLSDTEQRVWESVHEAKLDALGELIEETSEPVLCFYSFRSDAARIAQRFPQAREMDAAGAVVADWNAGAVPLLLAHPASAGHGLNLQSGGRTIVWFGPTWNLEHWQQANARLHRQGQARPVIAHVLLAQDTLDARVLDVMTGKSTVQEALLQAVKEAA